MVLMNASKKSRYVSSTVARTQGGGDKKAGFPHTVGRDHWVSIYMGNDNAAIINRHCCNLRTLQLPLVSTVCQSRPTGSIVQFNTYWHIPRTGR